MVKYIHNSNGTISNSFTPYLGDLLPTVSEVYKNDLTRSIIELDNNWSEFHQKLIGFLIRMLIQHISA